MASQRQPSIQPTGRQPREPCLLWAATMRRHIHDATVASAPCLVAKISFPRGTQTLCICTFQHARASCAQNTLVLYKHIHLNGAEEFFVCIRMSVCVYICVFFLLCLLCV